jgi:hypothetical protein
VLKGSPAEGKSGAPALGRDLQRASGLARGLLEGGGEGRRTSARLQVQRGRRLHPIVPAGSDPSLEGEAGHLPDHKVQARPFRQHLALTRIAISDIGLQSDRNAGP